MEFQPTHWSVVVSAKSVDDPHRKSSLNRLCDGYWKPLYVYLRKKGFCPDDAEDRVQGFFAHFLEKGFLNRVESGRGRFRNYLITVLEYYLANEYRREQAARRGNKNVEIAENEVKSSVETPEVAYLRSWSLTVLQQAFDALRREFESRGLPGHFDAVRNHLSAADDRASYEELARRLGTSVADVTNLLHRSRKRLRELIREILRETVDTEGEVDSEIRDLFSNS